MTEVRLSSAEEIAKSFAVESEAPSDQPDGFTDSSTGEFFPADDAALSRAPPDLDEGTFGLSGTSGGPVASKCVNYWDGTAPFCKGGPCKPGWHATREDKSGDGKKCWSGRKVYCECDVAPTCQDYWSGTGPFCKGQCASGYHELYQSPVGNGGLCLTGHKSYCQCNTPGVPPCQPTVIKKTCFSLLLICNNDCPKSLPYICGFCFKSRDASALEQTGEIQSINFVVCCPPGLLFPFPPLLFFPDEGFSLFISFSPGMICLHKHYPPINKSTSHIPRPFIFLFFSCSFSIHS